ncbi:uncharacterized protein TrAFT101_010297 [Trichoderma asperellum]|uniref:uncharacterized protein n=1 Tax=Trichoderma asperellum TaxID=101201 RepID=UPI003330FC02|nr:hypothetical protein TrAFT101_010297 [Trichoderma asperellum]
MFRPRSLRVAIGISGLLTTYSPPYSRVCSAESPARGREIKALDRRSSPPIPARQLRHSLGLSQASIHCKAQQGCALVEGAIGSIVCAAAPFRSLGQKQPAAQSTYSFSQLPVPTQPCKALSKQAWRIRAHLSLSLCLS